MKKSCMKENLERGENFYIRESKNWLEKQGQEGKIQITAERNEKKKDKMDGKL